MWLFWRIYYYLKRKKVNPNQYECPWCGNKDVTFNFNRKKSTSTWTCNRCWYGWEE